MLRSWASFSERATSPLQACPSESTTNARAPSRGPYSSSSLSIIRTPQASPSSMLVFQLVSSRNRNGGSSARWSRKKNSAFGSLVRRTCGAARWANNARATRSRRQPSTSAKVRIHATERCHRSGATSVTRIDVDPSCRTTKSTPAVSVTDTNACGRASATIASAAATLTASQNPRPPANR